MPPFPTTITTTPQHFHFKIDIYTDTVCPFSHLGFLSLTTAVSSFSPPTPVTFSLTYHPYILYPNSRPSSRKLGAALTYIYSSHTRTTSILTHLDNLASTYNIKFNWEGMTGNSRDSHRLILLAQSRFQASPSQQNLRRFMSRLYQASFQRGRDISSRQTLAELGVEAGLFGTVDKGLEWLDSGALGEEVDKECEKAKREIGVRAVPSYVVNEKYVVGGMQDPVVWMSLFDKIMRQPTSQLQGGGEQKGEQLGRREEHGGNCRVVAVENDT
ncbi:Putative protein of unknown function [Podospora comata]|uniref:DSBA-like thioredoxin domain-containing protein n=1 Tax=Podospora comata TaxID=48703 RepID=A0ABY6S9N8_PODCO|nr:Putative protein of unknown function [Podospora comata]